MSKVVADTEQDWLPGVAANVEHRSASVHMRELVPDNQNRASSSE